VPEGRQLDISPVRRSRLVFRIVERIEELIASGKIGPGDRLPGERELARQLGVGRYALREALRTLEARGVVNVRPGSGTFVSDMNTDKLRLALSSILLGSKEAILQLLQVRQFLEVKAVGVLASREVHQEGLDRLDDLVSKMESIPLGDESYAEYDTQFHQTLVHLLENPILSQIADSVRELTLEDIRALVRLPSMQKEATRYHRLILEAVKNGDPESAERYLQDHLMAVERRAIAYLG